ncbi:nucleolar protein net1 [Balamuthia mandrillaris]
MKKMKALKARVGGNKQAAASGGAEGDSSASKKKANKKQASIEIGGPSGFKHVGGHEKQQQMLEAAANADLKLMTRMSQNLKDQRQGGAAGGASTQQGGDLMDGQRRGVLPVSSMGGRKGSIPLSYLGPPAVPPPPPVPTTPPSSTSSSSRGGGESGGESGDRSLEAEDHAWSENYSSGAEEEDPSYETFEAGAHTSATFAFPVIITTPSPSPASVASASSPLPTTDKLPQRRGSLPGSSVTTTLTAPGGGTTSSSWSYDTLPARSNSLRTVSVPPPLPLPANRLETSPYHNKPSQLPPPLPPAPPTTQAPTQQPPRQPEEEEKCEQGNHQPAASPSEISSPLLIGVEAGGEPAPAAPDPEHSQENVPQRTLPEGDEDQRLSQLESEAGALVEETEQEVEGGGEPPIAATEGEDDKESAVKKEEAARKLKRLGEADSQCILGMGGKEGLAKGGLASPRRIPSSSAAQSDCGSPPQQEGSDSASDQLHTAGQEEEEGSEAEATAEGEELPTKNNSVFKLLEEEDDLMVIYETLDAMAIREGDIDEIVNRCNDKGETPLHVLCSEPSLRAEVLEYFIASLETDKNAMDKDGSTPLHRVCRKSADAGLIALLLQNGADVTLPNHKGERPLHLFVRHSVAEAEMEYYERALDVLLIYGAQLNSPDGAGDTPLMNAVRHGNAKVVSLLLSKGADPRAVNPNTGQSAVHLAVLGEKKKMLKALLTSAPATSCADKNGETPLDLAKKLKSPKAPVILKLLEGKSPTSLVTTEGDALRKCPSMNRIFPTKRRSNPSPNSSSYAESAHATLSTALNASLPSASASSATNSSFAPASISMVNNNPPDSESTTSTTTSTTSNKAMAAAPKVPIHTLVMAEPLSELKKKLDGRDINEKDKESGQTPLHILCGELHDPKVDVIEYLITVLKADPNSVDFNGWTPLHCVCKASANSRIVELLVNHGADTMMENADGTKPIHYLSRHPMTSHQRREDITRGLNLLLSSNCDINVTNKQGETALHNAVINGDEALLQLLIEKGAAVQCANVLGETPLHYAVLCQRRGLAMKLLEHGADPRQAYGKCESPLEVAKKVCTGRNQGIYDALQSRAAVLDMEGMTKEEKQAYLRGRAINELVNTEQDLIRDLTVLVRLFLNPVKESLATYLADIAKDAAASAEKKSASSAANANLLVSNGLNPNSFSSPTSSVWMVPPPPAPERPPSPVRPPPLLTQEQIDKIFGNIEEILEVSTNLYQDFQRCYQTQDQCFGKVFLEHLSDLAKYEKVCIHQQQSTETLNEALGMDSFFKGGSGGGGGGGGSGGGSAGSGSGERERGAALIGGVIIGGIAGGRKGNTNKEKTPFAVFCEQVQKHEDCRQLDIASFLIKPFQRITKYPLLIREVINYTHSDHMDAQALHQAREEINRIVTNANEKKRQNDNSRKIAEIEESFVWDSSASFAPLKLSEEPRTFLMEATFRVSRNNDKLSKQHLFLFNDVIIFTRAVHGRTSKNKTGHSSQKYSYLFAIPLACCVLWNVKDGALEGGSKVKNAFLVMHTIEQLRAVITARKEVDKTKWVEVINESIANLGLTHNHPGTLKGFPSNKAVADAHAASKASKASSGGSSSSSSSSGSSNMSFKEQRRHTIVGSGAGKEKGGNSRASSFNDGDGTMDPTLPSQPPSLSASFSSFGGLTDGSGNKNNSNISKTKAKAKKFKKRLSINVAAIGEKKNKMEKAKEASGGGGYDSSNLSHLMFVAKSASKSEKQLEKERNKARKEREKESMKIIKKQQQEMQQRIVPKAVMSSLTEELQYKQIRQQQSSSSLETPGSPLRQRSISASQAALPTPLANAPPPTVPARGPMARPPMNTGSTWRGVTRSSPNLPSSSSLPEPQHQRGLLSTSSPPQQSPSVGLANNSAFIASLPPEATAGKAAIRSASFMFPSQVSSPSPLAPASASTIRSRPSPPSFGGGNNNRVPPSHQQSSPSSPSHTNFPRPRPPVAPDRIHSAPPSSNVSRLHPTNAPSPSSSPLSSTSSSPSSSPSPFSKQQEAEELSQVSVFLRTQQLRARQELQQQQDGGLPNSHNRVSSFYGGVGIGGGTGGRLPSSPPPVNVTPPATQQVGGKRPPVLPSRQNRASLFGAAPVAVPASTNPQIMSSSEENAATTLAARDRASSSPVILRRTKEETEQRQNEADENEDENEEEDEEDEDDEESYYATEEEEEKLEATAGTGEWVKVLYDFVADEGSDQIDLHYGDVINVLAKDDDGSGWWYGTCDGRVGFFPGNYVSAM